jgi:hypothetical protein
VRGRGGKEFRTNFDANPLAVLPEAVVTRSDEDDPASFLVDLVVDGTSVATTVGNELALTESAVEADEIDFGSAEVVDVE